MFRSSPLNAKYQVYLEESLRERIARNQKLSQADQEPAAKEEEVKLFSKYEAKEESEDSEKEESMVFSKNILEEINQI